jgi:hypothetical protein
MGIKHALEIRTTSPCFPKKVRRSICKTNETKKEKRKRKKEEEARKRRKKKRMTRDVCRVRR